MNYRGFTTFFIEKQSYMKIFFNYFIFSCWA